MFYPICSTHCKCPLDAFCNPAKQLHASCNLCTHANLKLFCLFPRVAGAPGKLDYLYLTEPGEFTLTPRLRLTADGQPLHLQGKAVRIKVQTSETR